VPIARTGYQEYLPEELGLPGGGMIRVFRPEDEVFSEATMASFEAMPVTDDHPEDGVFIDNYKSLNMGHVHNVRRGQGEESDLVLADLMITDPHLIHEIMDLKKREISCGYTYDLAEEDGQYVQRNIRGNHVAVVDAGRAGHRVCIKDKKPERSKSNMKKSIAKLLARMAKDGDIEEVAEIIEEILEPEAATPVEAAAEAVEEVVAPVAAATEAAGDPSAVVETAEGNTIVVDEATLEELNSKLDRILDLLGGAPAGDEDPIVEEVAAAVEEALEEVAVVEPAAEVAAEETTPEEISEIVEEIIDPVVEDECDPEENEVLSSGDALRTALKAIHPQLKKMSKKQRQKACADIAARLKKSRKASGKDAYAALAAKKRTVEDPKDLGRRIMEKRNAHYAK
jgi:hypothetical protein